MKSGILICKQVKTGEQGKIAFQLTDDVFTKQKALRFFKEKQRREKLNGKTYEVEVSLEIHYQKRTLAQNKLLRALEAIMSMEQYNTEEYAQDFHEGLIEMYCPDKEIVNPITKRKQKKRTSELNTVEMAQVIGGAFYELANMGVEVTTGNIANYWIEWNRWRGKQGQDPFTAIGRSIEQYRHQVPICEACMKGLRSTTETGNEQYIGQIAHIVSRGAGGSDDLWNLIHLCTDCHIHTQHQHGWMALIKKYPHIAHRVARAQIQSGSYVSVLKDPQWREVHREIELILKYQEDEKIELVKTVFDGEEVDPEKVVSNNAK